MSRTVIPEINGNSSHTSDQTIGTFLVYCFTRNSLVPIDLAFKQQSYKRQAISSYLFPGQWHSFSTPLGRQDSNRPQQESKAEAFHCRVRRRGKKKDKAINMHVTSIGLCNLVFPPTMLLRPSILFSQSMNNF